MNGTRISVIALFSGLVLSLPAAAQQARTADQAILDQAVADHVRQTTDDREAVLRVLENDEVRRLAGQMGVDLKQAESAVATLDDSELAAMAAQARAVNDALAGGQSSITISTTLIIIGLLILILIIVAV